MITDVDACYYLLMLRAYIGVASNHGLSIFQPDRPDTISLIRESIRPGIRRLGFWAVLGHADAESVRALLHSGHRREAMMLLDRCAKHIGPIMPSDLERLSIH